MSAPENPPAFPRPLAVTHGGVHEHQVVEHGQDGMMLRDWFAGQALAGLTRDGLAHSSIPSLSKATGNDAEWRVKMIEAVTESCYALADSMLAERAKQP